ncbi:MFS transporter [Pseudomonas sp. zfem002]|uniref:MFS transporter n=1 Tax=Pseudomonas sp. zfem002 TaxID=3078197 RepID=UPI0029281379|nr:MFS transporter [Pseudomonas sp. zfem002]MDU9393316.1 MFS transporter [Pseudomonas sp. zfem002]
MPSAAVLAPGAPQAGGWRGLLFPLAIALCVGLDYFDNAAFAFFIRDIAGGVGAPPDELVWSSSAYAVAGVLGILQHQWWVERVGQRRYLAGNLLLFALGAVASACSETSLQLAGARALQGLAMGPMLGACRILLQLSFAPAQRSSAVRLFLILILFASALGPMLGGTLIALFGWRAVFLCTLPMALLIALLVFMVVPGSGQLLPEERQQTALWPWLLAALALAALQVVIQQSRFAPFSESPGMEALALLGVLVLAGFVWHQWHAPSPLLHLHTLKEATFRSGLLLYALYYFISNALAYLVSQLLQTGLGYPVDNAGHLVGVTALCAVPGALLYMRYAGKVQRKKWIFVPGFLLIAVICVWLARMPPDVSTEWLLPPLILRGLLLMFIALPVANVAFQSFAMDLYPHSYRIKNIVKQIAYSLATASIIVLQQHRFDFHRSVLSPNLSLSNPLFRSVQETLSRHFQHAGHDLASARELALAQLDQVMIVQASLLSYIDGFALLAVLSLAAAGFALGQRRID